MVEPRFESAALGNRPNRRQRLRATWLLVLAALVASVTRPAGAAVPRLWLEVTRAEDALACPDAQQVARSVVELFDARVVRIAAEPADAVLSVPIVITKSAEGFEATIQLERETSLPRRIVDRDARCHGLSEALAVAVVLLIEPHAEPKQRSSSTVRLRHSAPRVPLSVSATNLGMETGGLVGTGLIGNFGPPSLGTFIGGGVTRGGVGLQIRGMRVLRAAEEYGAGSLSLSLWAAQFGPCFRLQLPRDWALLSCAEVGLGQQRGSAHGFSVNRQDTAPWRVLVPQASLIAPLGGQFSAMLSIGGAFRLHRQDYRIYGEVAESQPEFAPFVALSMSVQWKIGRKL